MKYLNFKSNKKSNHGGGHNLTSLVDCFAIILIYLLMATSFGQTEIKVPEGMKLPKATEGKTTETTLVVEVKAQSYIVAGKPVQMSDLAAEFKRILQMNPEKKEQSVIIQADRNLSYGEINPVITAGLQAGFSEMQFAVSKEAKL